MTMEKLQLFADKPTAEAVAPTVAAPIAGQPDRARQAGPVGFVYRMPGKSIQWMVEAAVMAHARRWKRAPALIRVSPGNVEGARSSLRSLGFEAVDVVPNGGTLACEVETWEAAR